MQIVDKSAMVDAWEWMALSRYLFECVPVYLVGLQLDSAACWMFEIEAGCEWMCTCLLSAFQCIMETDWSVMLNI